GAVGTVHIGYLDQIDDQFSVTGGSWNYARLFGAGTRSLGDGRLLAGIELVHYDGPWDPGQDVRKMNAVLRYSEGEATEGWSATAMYYGGQWNNTTPHTRRGMDPPHM